MNVGRRNENKRLAFFSRDLKRSKRGFRIDRKKIDAFDLGINSRAALSRRIFALKNQHRRAFAWNDAVVPFSAAAELSCRKQMIDSGQRQTFARAGDDDVS